MLAVCESALLLGTANIQDLDSQANFTAPVLPGTAARYCRDYCEGLHDTLDLVVIGAWHGNGRKVG